MSIRVWKDVLYPGRQRDKHGTWFTVSRKSTQAAARNCRAMIGRGIRVPCVWEHQPGADPVEMSTADILANRVKHCFGEVTDAKVAPDGVLWLEHEVYEPADADTLKTKRLQVSPRLLPGFRDSKGNTYRGPVVGHVAATPTPVQFWQRPFELSQDNALLLSYGDDDMAKEDKAPKDEIPDAEPKDGAPDELPPETPEDVQGFEAVVQALRDSGKFTIPDEVQDWQHLVIAIKAGALDKGDELAPDSGTQPGPSAPLMMSDSRTLEPKKAQTRKDYAADVRLYCSSGRCTPHEARELLRELEATDLSFWADGNLVPNETVIKVKLIGKRKPWSAWRPDGKTDAVLELSTTVVEHPESLARKADAVSQSEADVVEETKRRARGWNPQSK